MGVYFNPGNESFAKDKNYKIYVDKTGLLNDLNELIGTPRNCLAVSHARRFGKSHAAGMIDAYYSLGSDSEKLFEDTKIAQNPDYKKYMNRYNVIHLDISTFWDSYKENITEKIVEYIYKDFKHVFGDELNYEDSLSYNLMMIYQKTKTPFVIIIDEWDCVIRNSENKELVHQYLQFLHSLFKSEESKAFLALAYITGILPIKKIKDESALNNFSEYTMLKSKPITQYYGFTEDEVKVLCERFNMDFESMKAWYSGSFAPGAPFARRLPMLRARTERIFSFHDAYDPFARHNAVETTEPVFKILFDGFVSVNGREPVKSGNRTLTKEAMMQDMFPRKGK